MATYNNIAYGNIGALGTASGEVLLQTVTASSSANLTFSSGIDSTYKIYKFVFLNIHPAEDNRQFAVNFRDGGVNYDAIKTTTFFQASHKEDNSEAQLSYNTSGDLAQSASVANLDRFVGNDADQCCSGQLFLYDPSNTTFVKHFVSKAATAERTDQAQQGFLAGYCNTTTAINGVQFSMTSGNIDSGTISMYGIK